MNLFYKKLGEYENIVIFGYSPLGLELYSKLGKLNKKIFFCDNSSKKQAENENVYSVYDIVKRFNNNAVYLVASLYHYKEMDKQLIDMGISSCNIIDKIPNPILRNVKKQIEDNKLIGIDKLKLEINIVKHCNLKCKGCDHFSPLANETYIDLKFLKKDLLRLRELFKDSVEYIYILGGEPLLHPEINKCMKYVRDIFPEDTINVAILTNGVLLKSMDDIFWGNCKKYHIKIMPTKYPINLDYDELQKFVQEKEISYEYAGSSEHGRSLWHFPLDLKGEQDIFTNFKNCRNANSCITLENGKLYTCSIAPHIDIFNTYFNKNLQLSDEDGIDIYKQNSAKKIAQLLAKPIPFCRYCDVKNRTYDHLWGTSQKDIREWT